MSLLGQHAGDDGADLARAEYGDALFLEGHDDPLTWPAPSGPFPDAMLERRAASFNGRIVDMTAYDGSYRRIMIEIEGK
jgi:hypothetical protein